jgi:MFS transporter, DHA2 family, multidrug resistance protein
VLVAALAAIAAAGFNPLVYSPGFPSVQAAVRARPEVAALLVAGTLVSAGLLFVGGVLADTDGRRRLLLGALVALVVAGAVGLVVMDGPVFLLDRLAGAAASSAILPFALALVATTYRGIPRATAIGIVYSVYGAAQGAGPVLLTIFGQGGSMWPAFAASAAAAAIAFWIVRSRAPDLPAVARDQRSYVVATAIWAFAIVIITTGLVGIGNGLAEAVGVGLMILGLVMAAGFIAWERRKRAEPGIQPLRIDRRPVTVAVAAGLVIGFAQAAPLFQLPLFFRVVLSYGPLAATLATVPFMLALVAAGPIAGKLLARSSPRHLVAAGLAGVGLGNLVAAAVLGAQTPYLAIVIAFALIGVGFVIATTVRTAIIFASVPRGLPATAAALNQASLQVGGSIGLVLVTVGVSRLALDFYGNSLVGLDPAQRDAAVATFRSILDAIGTPAIGALAPNITPDDFKSYTAAFTDALRYCLGATGLVALLAAPISWIALGRRDPLKTVFDHSDERAEGAAPVPGQA